MAAVAVKLALFSGVLALVGPGFFVRFVMPGGVSGETMQRLRAVTFAGGVMMLLASAASLVVTLHGVVGFVDAPLLRDYATNTTHGRSTIVRAALVLVLLLIAHVEMGRVGSAAFAVASLGVLGTLALVSHNAAMGGWLPVVADLAHLVAMVAWISGVVGLTYLRQGQFATRWSQCLGRVSAIGLAAVAVLFGTGTYAATLHLGQPSSLASTGYGLALVAKVGVVLAIVGIAARNRWHHLPRARRGDVTPAFVRALRVECGLLALVLVLTSVLTSLAPPH